MSELALESRRASAPVRTFVRAHTLAVFFALAIGLSWAYWIPDALAGGHWSHYPGLVGPAVAAFVVAALCGRDRARELRARTTRVRVAPRWYAAALVPLTVAAVVVLTQVAITGGTDGRLSDMTGLPDVGWFGVAALVLLVDGFGEEIGWRGFAWPALRSGRSLVRASFLLALPWAIWHVPLLWIDSGMRGMGPAMFPGFVLSLACGAVVLGWLFDRTASVAVVAVWHTALNLATATAATTAAAPVVSVAVIVLALVLVRLDRGATAVT